MARMIDCAGSPRAHFLTRIMRTTSWTFRVRSLACLTPLLVGLAMTPLPAYGFLDVIDQLQQELEGGAPVVKAPTAPLQNLLKELDVTTVPTFSDVPSFAWYATYVVTVATWKIVEGYRDATGARTGLFGPGDPVT